MKQIIPFKKELLFKTKVSEITSISLEHTLSLRDENSIGGEFLVTGDYKMTEGSIHRENFSFQLPFEIALDSEYDMSTVVIDIDNFYYEVINNESLQVNIDVYVEGEKKELVKEPVIEVTEEKLEKLVPEEMKIEFPEITDFKEERNFLEEEKQDVRIESNLLSEQEERKKQNNTMMEKLEKNIEHPSIDSIVFEKEKEESSNVQIKEMKNDFQIFGNIDNSETYVTYHVYVVKDVDTIDSIMKKYEVSKETLSLYNEIEEIKPGMKLIIPN